MLDRLRPEDKNEKERKGMTRRGFLGAAGRTAGKLAALGFVSYAGVGGPLVGKVARPEKPLKSIENPNKHPAISLKFHQLKKLSPEQRQKWEVQMQYQSANFSEDWKHPLMVETPMGERVPLRYMVPQEPKSNVPVIMVPGWTANDELWKGNMRQFVAHGRIVMMMSTTHGIRYSRDVQERIDTATDRATYTEYRKIAAIMAALDSQKVEKSDAVAHSEGCIDLIMAALAYPERFRTIVLVNPAGMIGEDSFFTVAWRNQLGDVPSMNAAREARKRGDPTHTFHTHPDDPVDVDTITPALKGPYGVQNTLFELSSVAWVQIAELLREVKAKGVNVVVVSSGEDKMFPAEYMLGKPRRDAGGNIVYDANRRVIMETTGALTGQIRADEPDSSKIFDEFVLTEGIHVRFFDQPVEYTWLVNDLLTEREALEAKQ